MSELGEMYKSLNTDKKKRHRDWNRLNTKILDDSGIEYKKASSECYLFRSEKINTDFYPSTGRWKYNNIMYHGGAEQFIRWWNNKQEATNGN